jgi:malate permease and related proteins
MNFVLIAVCLVAGFVLRSLKVLPENAHKGINAWILYIAVPAIALLYIPSITWNSALVLPVAMPLLVWGGAWLILKLFAPRSALENGTRTALLLTAGLSNTSFVGFPLTQAYWGDEGLRIAVICDQITFIVFATLGVMNVLNTVHGTDIDRKKSLKRIFLFPPFLAFLVAILLSLFVNVAPFIPLLTRLAATVVPLALFSVGMQIRFSEWRRELPALSVGLAYKLLIAPAVVLCVARAFGIKGIVGQTSVFEAAMAPMITAAILCAEYNLNPRLSYLMVSIGIVVSMATTAFWSFILHAVL